MNMKKSFIGILAATIILSGCGTSQMAAGDPNAVLAGAAIGSNVGGAIGGLIGDSNGGWRGGYRGSAIGTIIGTIAGAAIANAATAPKKQEEYSYRIERTQPYPPQSGRQPQASAIDHLRIRNIRFIDDSRNHVINSGENCKVIFEIMNEGNKTAYNVAGGGGNHGHEAYLHIAVGHDRANNSAQRCEIHRQHQCRRTDKDG